MRQRIAALLGVFAVAIAGLVALAFPAQAANQNGHCETGEMCMWQNTWHAAGVFDSFYSVPNLNTKAFVRNCVDDCSVNDNVSSLRNYDAGKYVRSWEHANYSGGLFTRKWANAADELDAAMDLTIDKFASTSTPVNDRISSFCFVYETSPIQQCRGISR